tara:strand:- start:192 stop:1910 length:1719 start_codon:yes stop_codon:yes gene_type:complete
MAIARGTLSKTIQPYGGTSDNLINLSWNWRANYMKSANTQMRYQIEWSGLDENQEPSKANFISNAGDVINIVFRVYATSEYPYPASSLDWQLVGSIRKARDIANESYITGAGSLSKQRYTVDISSMCQDLLSYSLVPLNKGTWQSSAWGGMNGGQTKQDNVAQTVSNYNVTPNGTYRHIYVTATPEIILANGTIAESTDSPLGFNKIAVINSVAQFEKEDIYYNDYIIRNSLSNPSFPKGFLSLCPNFTQTQSVPFLKQVRTDVDGEWLYWYQRNIGDSSTTPNTNASKARLKCETYLSDGTSQNIFYLSDFNSNLDTEVLGGITVFSETQNRICVQNVSPTYINANAQDDSGNPLTNQIDSSTQYYKAHLEYLADAVTIRATEYRFFNIDRETYNNAFGFVRFYWLNRMGGIDSYTAKRDVMESISVSKSSMETRSADRTWYQDNQKANQAAVPDNEYVSNTMRGGNLYKGGREVLSVNAERNNSVFTEPLNKQTADWLEEIITSPNVWIEMDTDATQRGNTVNPFQRPSTKGYIPVIITNSDIETLNQETQMVKFNIEYTLSHKVQTQRN